MPSDLSFPFSSGKAGVAAGLGVAKGGESPKADIKIQTFL